MIVPFFVSDQFLKKRDRDHSSVVLGRILLALPRQGTVSSVSALQYTPISPPSLQIALLLNKVLKLHGNLCVNDTCLLVYGHTKSTKQAVKGATECGLVEDSPKSLCLCKDSLKH